METRQPLIKLILGLLLIGVGLWVVVDNLPAPHVDPSTIHSYDACAAAGYPILKSYPAKCVLPDGTEFIQSLPVKTFEECAQYYPVMESYPAKCATPDGQVFTQSISQMGFDPTQPFVLLSTTSGGITGKVTSVRFEYSMNGYSATIINFEGTISGVVTEEDSAAVLAALEKVDFTTEPDVTGPDCCDISITTLTLTQGGHSWEISVNGAMQAPSTVQGLMNALGSISVKLYA